MQTLIVCDSKFGNTKKVAEAVAEALGTVSEVRTLGPAEVLPEDLDSSDLLVVAGPTQNHGLSEPMRQFLDALFGARPVELMACVFDTRFRMAELLSGSAAKVIAKRLQRAGVTLLWPTESFFVTRGAPSLEPNELERARAWGRQLVARLKVQGWCAA